jgi:hypothetical protein
VIAPAHFQIGIFRHLLPRFCELGLTAENKARHNKRLGTRAAFHQPSLDEQLIEATLSWQSFWVICKSEPLYFHR